MRSGVRSKVSLKKKEGYLPALQPLVIKRYCETLFALLLKDNSLHKDQAQAEEVQPRPAFGQRPEGLEGTIGTNIET